MKYLVKSPILRNGKEFAAGDTIELSESQAAEMPWAVELAEAAPKKATIKDAIEFLKGHGLSGKDAKAIVDEHGPEAVLADGFVVPKE